MAVFTVQHYGFLRKWLVSFFPCWGVPNLLLGPPLFLPPPLFCTLPTIMFLCSSWNFPAFYISYPPPPFSCSQNALESVFSSVVSQKKPWFFFTFSWKGFLPPYSSALPVFQNFSVCVCYPHLFLLSFFPDLPFYHFMKPHSPRPTVRFCRWAACWIITVFFFSSIGVEILSVWEPTLSSSPSFFTPESLAAVFSGRTGTCLMIFCLHFFSLVQNSTPPLYSFHLRQQKPTKNRPPPLTLPTLFL